MSVWNRWRLEISLLGKAGYFHPPVVGFFDDEKSARFIGQMATENGGDFVVIDRLLRETVFESSVTPGEA